MTKTHAQRIRLDLSFAGVACFVGYINGLISAYDPPNKWFFVSAAVILASLAFILFIYAAIEFVHWLQIGRHQK